LAQLTIIASVQPRKNHSFKSRFCKTVL